MPTIRMKVKLSGNRDGKLWPNPGETIDVPDDEARQLVGMQCAELVDDETPVEAPVETATAPEPPVETATKDAAPKTARRRAAK